MSQATVTFELGSESVTSVLEVDLSGETILTGDIGGLVAAGTVARLSGVCRLIEDLHVRGTLTCDPSGVDVDGDGFDIHTHDGGILNLAGVAKSGWVRWGEPVTNWAVGDRLVVAPTSGYVPVVITWQGSWAATPRPALSQPFSFSPRIYEPEVGNLTRSVVFRNLTRMMMHESTVSNVHTLKHFAMVNPGKLSTGFYPIHFHALGDTCRGSLVEGVVVEGSKFRAFVPHASHGVTFRDCIAYNIIHDAYWWDQPPVPGSTINDTHDTVWEHCLGIDIKTPTTAPRQATFLMGQGDNNRCIDCAAVANQNTKDAAGFTWPESGVGVWEFRDCVAHNNKGDGIFVWQNDDHPHVITDFVGYRNGRSQVDHGAYTNRYQYRNLILAGGTEGAFKLHARPVVGFPILVEDVVASGRLLIPKHQSAFSEWAIFRRASFNAGVHYEETFDSGTMRSYIRYEDCNLTPANFTLTGIIPTSRIEIYEAGVLTHSWFGGWT